MLFLFFILFVVGIIYFQSKPKLQETFLAFECVVLALLAGWRNESWPDTGVYIMSFSDYTNSIFNFSWVDQPFGYAEMGFYYLGVIIKTFIDDEHIYLTVIAGLSMFFLYKGLRRYSIYPLIGILAYVARFYSARNLCQIRSGLAYAIIIAGFYLIHERKLLKYLLLVWVASWFHKSAIIALPFYFFCNFVRIDKRRTIYWLVIAFVLGAFFQGPISAFVIDNSEDLDVSTYTQGNYVEDALGLGNPMIYFQCFWLLLYTFLEDKLAPITKYYYTIRAGYLYSTLILITFCSFTALSGRTSTMFATLEFCIIPSMINIFPKSQRSLYAVFVGFILLVIMLMKVRGDGLYFI